MKLLIPFCLLLISFKVMATPAQIIILRHAEKVSDEDNNLSEKGKQRAERLHLFFDRNVEASRYGVPVAIYAAAQKKSTTSRRSIQTMVPYANLHRLTVNDAFTKEDYKEMIKEIMQKKSLNGKTVIICFPHSHIPKLTKKFGYEEDMDWSDDVFDRVWILRFDGKDKATDILDLGQRLLPGDSN